MKKIKVMLACIAVLATVGGVFAFKAKNAFTTAVFYTTGTSATNCNLDGFSTSEKTSSTPYFYYELAGGTCTTKTYITSED